MSDDEFSAILVVGTEKKTRKRIRVNVTLETHLLAQLHVEDHAVTGIPRWLD